MLHYFAPLVKEIAAFIADQQVITKAVLADAFAVLVAATTPAPSLFTTSAPSTTARRCRTSSAASRRPSRRCSSSS